MHVVVHDHYKFDQDHPQEYTGDEGEVRQELLTAYPWLRHKLGPHAAVELLVQALNQSQAHSAAVTDADLILKTEGDEGGLAAMLGYDLDVERAFEAARFLTDSAPPSAEARRQAFFEADGEPLRAALLAHGLAATPENLRALEAVLEASGLKKAEDSPLPQEAVPVTEAATEFGAAVQRALAAGKARHVRLGGKHSQGSLVATDPETGRRYLLKPGHGKQPPAAGASESGSSQSKREAAFWAVADQWGLGEDLPEAHLLLLDGREYAAMRLLGGEFRTALQAEQKDHGYVRRLFQLRRPDGKLHQWATLDYVLGNSDRHAQNVMARGEEVQLIDHGSTMAGQEFAPATDQFTFVPFYLRALAPPNFNELSPSDQLRHLPRLHPHAAKAFGEWLHALDAKVLEETLHRYGIEAAPAVNRLKALQAATAHAAPDLAVLQAWVVP